MRFLALALSLALSTTAASADVSWNTQAMAPGSVMVMKDSDGIELMHVARGKVEGLKRFDMYEGRGADALYIGSYLTTDDGNVVRHVAADGVSTNFAPHRCNRTLGECKFTMTHWDGFKETRTRVTRATREGLQWQEFDANGLVAEGVMRLDEIGANKGGWRKKKEGRKVRTKRIMIALK